MLGAGNGLVRGDVWPQIAADSQEIILSQRRMRKDEIICYLKYRHVINYEFRMKNYRGMIAVYLFLMLYAASNFDVLQIVI